MVCCDRLIKVFGLDFNYELISEMSSASLQFQSAQRLVIDIQHEHILSEIADPYTAPPSSSPPPPLCSSVLYTGSHFSIVLSCKLTE